MGSLFPKATEPATALARHRILSPTAAVRVSPLCLGAMNFGDAWKEYLGECNKETSFGLLDFFWKSGGNFIDTANNYQYGESESWIGEWMEKNGNRDQMVLATKYTTNFHYDNVGPHDILSNYSGNGHKSLLLSVEASLKKLRTSYIDLLYIHWYDMTTPVEEMMQSLNYMVQTGKVLYLGISDTPAWIVSKANQYARDHGLKQFSVYQGLWNASERDLERDILPMCEAEGMSIAPWGALGRGVWKTEAQRKEGGGRTVPPSEGALKMTNVLEGIAKSKGTTITSIAMAFVMSSSPYRVFPIVGGRKIEHLKANIEALNVRLTIEERETIEKASGFDYGFPVATFIPGVASSTRISAVDSMLNQHINHLDIAPKLSQLPEAGM